MTSPSHDPLAIVYSRSICISNRISSSQWIWITIGNAESVEQQSWIIKKHNETTIFTVKQNRVAIDGFNRTVASWRQWITVRLTYKTIFIESSHFQIWVLEPTLFFFIVSVQYYPRNFVHFLIYSNFFCDNASLILPIHRKNHHMRGS